VSLLVLLDLQSISLFLFLSFLFFFVLVVYFQFCFYTQNPKKLVYTFCYGNMGDQTTKLCDFTNVSNVQFITNPITSPKIKVDSFEVSPRLLNLIAKDQFGGSASEDASMQLHDFCEIRDMQKFKNVEK
jgi:hypothetical protein